jgi:hypothetical protein
VGELPLAEGSAQGDDQLDLLHAFFPRTDYCLQLFLVCLFKIQGLEVADPAVLEESQSLQGRLCGLGVH